MIKHGLVVLGATLTLCGCAHMRRHCDCTTRLSEAAACGGCTTLVSSEPAYYPAYYPAQSMYGDTGTRSTYGYFGQRPVDYRYRFASSTASQDEAFLRDAAMDNQSEIELARLALRNASNPDVKRFAQRLIDAHNRVESDIESLTRNTAITLPPQLDIEHRQMVNRLAGLSGDDFDREFLNMMIKDHKEAIAKFEERANAEPSNAVSNFAARTLPRLREHLRTAQDIQAKL